jgi:hypothetical protein
MADRVFSLILGPEKIGPPRGILFRSISTEFKPAKILCLP